MRSRGRWCVDANPLIREVDSARPAPLRAVSRIIPEGKGCTLAAYAALKRLPEDFLRNLGLRDGTWNGAPAVVMPYCDVTGETVSTRYRTALTKGPDSDDRFRWNRGDVPTLYGLWRWLEASVDNNSSIVIVEGESDCHTLWFHGIAAYGVPGATVWNGVERHLADYRTVYVVQEPDGGGDAMRARAASLPAALRLKIQLVTLGAFKDVSELHLKYPDDAAFRERWDEAIDSAEPLESPAVPALAGATEEAFPTSWRVLDDVAVMQLPDPEWIVQNLIPKRARVCIYAPPNTAKTTLTAGLGVAIATGRDWFGLKVCTRGNVLYVPSEDVSGFKVRLAAAKQQARLAADHVVGVCTFDEGLNLLDVTMVTQFIRFVREQAGAFVTIIIDTLSGSMPGANENAIEAMGLAMAHAKLIMDELDVTVILLHHTNASGNRERGHTVVRAECDTMIALNPVDDIVQVENNKQRNGPWLSPFDVRVVPLGTSVVLRLAKEVLVPPGEVSEHQRRALVALRDTFTSEGASASDWKASATATGMSEATFWRASKKLTETLRYVAQEGRFYRLTSSGRAALQGLGL